MIERKTPSPDGSTVSTNHVFVAGALYGSRTLSSCPAGRSAEQLKWPDHRVTALMQTGSASVEYVLVTVAVMSALFLPVPGLETSIVDFVLEALRGFQANSTYLLSLP